jgi:hypothetical protein
MLGPHVHVSSKDTLRRLLVYLGATAEQLADFDQCIRSWGQGTATITLQPGRKNLLRLGNLVPPGSKRGADLISDRQSHMGAAHLGNSGGCSHRPCRPESGIVGGLTRTFALPALEPLDA